MCQRDRTFPGRLTVNNPANGSRDSRLVFDECECPVSVDEEGRHGAVGGFKTFVEAEEETSVGVYGEP